MIFGLAQYLFDHYRIASPLSNKKKDRIYEATPKS